jgi:hypothetical protein
MFNQPSYKYEIELKEKKEKVQNSDKSIKDVYESLLLKY